MADTASLLSRLRAVDRSECDEALTLELERWEKRVGELEAMRAVSETFVIKGLLDDLRAQIAALDTRLLSERGLERVDRDAILDRKEMYASFIAGFDVTAQLSTLEAQIKENLSDL